MGDGLPGKDRKRLGAAGRRACSKLAKGEPDAKKRARLLEATCGRSWVERLTRKQNGNAVADEGTMKNLSGARAAAKNPVLTGQMFQNITDMTLYAQHYADGLMLTEVTLCMHCFQWND